MSKILTAPHPVLTAPAKPIQKIDRKIKRLIVNMEEALVNHRDPQGVGLAAPQVGISLALFIIKSKPTSESKVFINPRILKSHSEQREESPAYAGSNKLRDPSPKAQDDNENTRSEVSNKPPEEKMEGCLSVPRIWAALKRPRKTQIEYQDLTGEKKVEWFSGLEAVIVQHEIDHLHGILFTQKCLEQKVPLYEEKGDKLVKLKSL